jgi:hypothetical protein
MTADFYPFDMTFLGRATIRITDQVKGVNRLRRDREAGRERSSGRRGVNFRNLVLRGSAWTRRRM